MATELRLKRAIGHPEEIQNEPHLDVHAVAAASSKSFMARVKENQFEISSPGATLARQVQFCLAPVRVEAAKLERANTHSTWPEPECG